MQRETLTLSASEVRFTNDDGGTFSGYASIFGEPTSYGEVVQRGAFAKTLREHKQHGTKPAMFWSHDPAAVIGVWEEFSEDDRGLKVRGRLITETARGAEAHTLLKAGAVNGLSIGFRSRADKRGPNGVRILTDVDLVEISLVSLPAASKARVVSVRNSAPADIAAFLAACRTASQALKKGYENG